MIDVLFVAYNRLAYTRESFDALIAYTNWAKVARLYVSDDGSTDGTWEWLSEAFTRVPVPVVARLGPSAQRGPVAAMNWYLDDPSVVPCETCKLSGVLDGEPCWRCQGTLQAKVEMFAKVDNDMVVCHDWLDEMLNVTSRNPHIDILGMEPMIGPPMPGRERRGFEEARHIGGKGLIRIRSFERCRPTPSGVNGYQGFTQWQVHHPDVVKAWIRPELPVFGLDQLPFEPWRSLREEYVGEGWQRRWGEYDERQNAYWSWWHPVHLEDARSVGV